MWKYESIYIDNSYGFRPNRDCHGAMEKALEYLNESYEWIKCLDEFDKELESRGLRFSA